MKKLLALSLPAAALTVAATLLLPGALRAADHGDAPGVSQDSGADIADEYAFLDPNDNTRVIMIGTVHGFIVPGEAGNFAAFDSNVRYRFEIYNKHVNLTPPVLPASPTAAQKAAFARAQAAYLATIYPNRFIDVTFSKRVVPAAPADTKFNLVKPGPQSATLTLIGFPGAGTTKTITKTTGAASILTTNATLAGSPNPQTKNIVAVDSDPAHNITVFAGETDDPFFFDLVGFSRLITSIHDGATDTTQLNRARDTFAGYNVLAIAFSIPKALLVDATQPNAGKKLGFDFLTMRHTAQIPGTDGPVGSGPYKTVDRVGNPAVNVALIPFNKKNSYNVSTPKIDAGGKFVPDILATIAQLGLNTPPANVALLANVAVAHGDLLQLDTTIPNTGTGGGDVPAAAFPNGRRLKDDVIDTILSVLAGGTIGDGVSGNDVPFQDTFPFLGLPQQPRANGVIDDNTKN